MNDEHLRQHHASMNPSNGLDRVECADKGVNDEVGSGASSGGWHDGDEELLRGLGDAHWDPTVWAIWTGSARGPMVINSNKVNVATTK